MSAKRLSLKKELLTELTNDDLKRVAGGQLGGLTGTETYRCPTTPITRCTFTDSCFTGTTGTN